MLNCSVQMVDDGQGTTRVASKISIGQLQQPYVTRSPSVLRAHAAVFSDSGPRTDNVRSKRILTLVSEI
jgi:hypothetical protein